MTKGWEIADWWVTSHFNRPAGELESRIDSAISESVEKEREECAKLVEQAAIVCNGLGFPYELNCIAGKIRKRSNPQWCEHFYQLKCSTTGKIDWRGGGSDNWVPNTWTRCPICGKPKP